jgi:hypothetical protein
MTTNPTRSSASFPQSGDQSHSSNAELHAEGPVARSIEHYTAQIPSDVYLWAAGGSILASLALQFKGHKDESLFVGQWAAPFLLLGIYNKLVKLGGSDRLSR